MHVHRTWAVCSTVCSTPRRPRWSTSPVCRLPRSRAAASARRRRASRSHTTVAAQAAHARWAAASQPDVAVQAAPGRGASLRTPSLSPRWRRGSRSVSTCAGGVPSASSLASAACARARPAPAPSPRAGAAAARPAGSHQTMAGPGQRAVRPRPTPAGRRPAAAAAPHVAPTGRRCGRAAAAGGEPTLRAAAAPRVHERSTRWAEVAVAPPLPPPAARARACARVVALWPSARLRWLH